MKISGKFLLAILGITALLGLNLTGCAAQDIAAVAGQAAGGVGLSGLFKTSPDKLSPEERVKYIESSQMLTYKAPLDEVSKIVDEVVKANQQALHIARLGDSLATVKEIFLARGNSSSGETYAVILVDFHPAWKDHVSIIVQSGNRRTLSMGGVIARRLKILIDNALRERKVALVG